MNYKHTDFNRLTFLVSPPVKSFGINYFVAITDGMNKELDATNRTISEELIVKYVIYVLQSITNKDPKQLVTRTCLNNIKIVDELLVASRGVKSSDLANFSNPKQAILGLVILEILYIWLSNTKLVIVQKDKIDLARISKAFLNEFKAYVLDGTRLVKTIKKMKP